MTQPDSLDRLALELGRRNSLAADNHAHRARNHLQRVDEALKPLLDLADLRHELRVIQQQLSDLHSRIELRFQSNTRRFGGPKFSDTAAAHEVMRKPSRRTEPKQPATRP